MNDRQECPFVRPVVSELELGENIYQHSAGKNIDDMPESSAVGHARIVNHSRRLPRAAAIGRAGEHALPSIPVVAIIPSGIDVAGVGRVGIDAREVGIGTFVGGVPEDYRGGPMQATVS